MRRRSLARIPAVCSAFRIMICDVWNPLVAQDGDWQIHRGNAAVSASLPCRSCQERGRSRQC